MPVIISFSGGALFMFGLRSILRKKLAQESGVVIVTATLALTGLLLIGSITANESLFLASEECESSARQKFVRV